MARPIWGELGRPIRHTLSLAERALVAAGYLLVLAVLLLWMTGDFSFLTEGPLSTLFVSFALLLVLGNYVLEPFYARPADVFVNSVALLLALNGMGDFFDRNAGTLLLSIGLVVLAGMAFLLLVVPEWWSGQSRDIVYRLTTRLGRSKVVFTAAYAALIVSYFSHNEAIFWLLLGYILLVLVVAPAELIAVGLRTLMREQTGPRSIGHVSERTGKESFRITIPFRGDALAPEPTRPLLLKTLAGTYMLVAPLNREVGPSDYRVECRTITSEGSSIIYDAKFERLSTDAINAPLTGDVFDLDLSSAEGESTVLKALTEWQEALPVGLVSPGTDSLTILVDLFDREDDGWEEGAILSVGIGGMRCLIQVISVESVQSVADDSYRSIRFRVKCAKLGGERLSGHGFDAVPWVPAVATPVFRASRVVREPGAEATSTLGHIPGIEKAVSLTDPHKLVTHNSAILGALGSGKTSLAMSLVSSIVADTDCRIISIDVTEEHQTVFGRHVGPSLVNVDQAPFTVDLGTNVNYVHLENRQGSSQPVQEESKSGNVAGYRVNVRAAICHFLFDAPGPANTAVPEITGTKRILVIDPNQHEVTRGEKVGFQVVTVPLSAAEKTRIIAEELLSISMKLGLTRHSRLLLVLEEAHTLVPEFSFAAQDGDRTATNGTARVILQGRKYGLGAMVVAQRSANVSKSILSQCSTVFALRIFDDTGKAFLANFVGSAFAESLPQLPPFHAVVVGAGLQTEQPLMVRLRAPSVSVPQDLTASHATTP